ncbi:MAG: helix-turn-helix domain-containing protein [Chloroflexi bacterium]|nr:helix-turn-helix domain-containing protein [Chloroflexota bacterium]
MAAADRWLTVDRVVERIQVNKETMRRWLRSGRLRGVQPGGDKVGWRVTEADIDRFLAADSNGHQPSA